MGDDAGSSRLKLGVEDARRALSASGSPFVVLFEDENLALELFAPMARDTQGPHPRDEIYIITRGSAVFDRDGEKAEVRPGDVLFVPAWVPHRFASFSDDFETWVGLFGPEKPPRR